MQVINGSGSSPEILVRKTGQEIERMPDPGCCAYLGQRLPLLQLNPFRPSAPAALRLAVAGLKRGNGDWPVAVQP